MKSYKLFLPALLAALVLAIYWNSLGNSYVWDDRINFSENPNIRNFPLVLHSLFSPQYTEVARERYYRPLVTLSYALEYKVWGYRPVLSHAINLIFHAFNSILIFVLLARLVPTWRIAAAAALLFAAHPIQTNCAAYVNGRMEILCTFFFLISIILFIKIRDHSNKQKCFLPLSIISFVLALLSKEMALTLPFILLILYFFFVKPASAPRLPTPDSKQLNIENRKLKISNLNITIFAPYFLIAIGYLAFRFFYVGGSALQTQRSLTPYLTFLMMLKATVLYMKLLIYPVKLCADYFSLPVSVSILDKEILSSAGAIIAVLAFAVYGLWRNRLVFFSIFWFFITLLPVMNIIPLLTFVSEKFLYLPSIGFCILLATIMHRAFEHQILRNKKIIFWLVMILVVGVYSQATIKRNAIWKNELILFRDTAKCSPHSASIHVKYGNELCRLGNCEEALQEYEKALALQTDAAIYCNMGEAYGRLGEYDKAAEAFQQCLELEPENSTACERLSLALKLSGKPVKLLNSCKK